MRVIWQWMTRITLAICVLVLYLALFIYADFPFRDEEPKLFVAVVATVLTVFLWKRVSRRLKL